MEPKLVQRCETEVFADACNASYCVAFTNTTMLFNRTTVVFTRTIVVFNRTILANTDVHYNYVVLVSVVLLIVILLTPSPATTYPLPPTTYHLVPSNIYHAKIYFCVSLKKDWMTHIHIDRKTLQLMERTGLGDDAVNFQNIFFSASYLYQISWSFEDLYIFNILIDCAYVNICLLIYLGLQVIFKQKALF